jgi:hypothetical protein
MTPIDAAVLVLALTLGFLRIIYRELDKAEAEDLHRCGIVIVRERVLEGHSQPIGEYLGHQIWRTVTFRGLVYRFDRIQGQSRREQLAPGELYLDPGLVYVTGRG